MLKLRLILAATLLSTITIPILSGCATLGTVLSATATPVCSRTTVDEKTLYIAEASYNVVASAYKSANTHGLISADVKAVVKPKLQLMYSYLKGARVAYNVCDTATLASYGIGIEQLKAAVLPLISHS